MVVLHTDALLTLARATALSIYVIDERKRSNGAELP
jgi:hypothetical protein